MPRPSAETDMLGRDLAFYVGLVAMPFIMVAGGDHIGPLLALVGLLLVAPAIGWVMIGRDCPREARLSQAVVASVFILLGYATGFGAGLSLALFLLVVADPLLFLTFTWPTARQVAVWLAVLFCAGVVVASVTSEAHITAFYVPACLALPSLVLQIACGRRALAARATTQPTEQSARARLTALAEGEAKDAVVLFDRGGRVTAVSVNAAAVLLIGEEDLIGRGLVERLHLADRPLLLKMLADTMSGEPVRPLVLRVRREPPHPNVRIACYDDYEARPLRPDDDAGIAVLLTRHHPVVSAAPPLPMDGQQGSLRLSELGHDLRTPLNAILGFADLLANPATQPKSPGTIAEYAQLIRDAGDVLRAVVELLLDMSRLQAGQYVMMSEPLKPAEIVARARGQLARSEDELLPDVELVGTAPVETWFNDARAATRMLSGLVAAHAALRPTTRIEIAIDVEDADIVFTLQSASQRLGTTPDREGAKALTPPVALGLELAAALARHQNGAAILLPQADDGVFATLRLPLVLAASGQKGETLKLDDFRRPDGRMPAGKPLHTVKKHA